MSRSEQLHDASMEEILASIRKIITDDEPEAPVEDAFSAAAIDDFREASATLARGQPAGGYMHDLTRALAGDGPATADDDIFDDGGPTPEYAAVQPLPQAGRAEGPRTPAFTPAPADDDADLFETEPEAVVEAAPEPAAVEVTEDEEIIEDLGEPIALGPEIELVEVAPVIEPQPATVSAIAAIVAGGVPAAAKAIAENAAEAVAAVVEIAGSPEVEAAPVAVAPPPPPPPVLASLSEEIAEPVAGITTEAIAASTESVAETVADQPVIAEAVTPELAPAVDPVAEVVAEPGAAEISESIVAPIAEMAQSVPEAARDLIAASSIPSLEASAAALVEEFSASVAEPSAAPVAEPVAAEAALAPVLAAAAPEPAPPVESATVASEPPPAAPLVPDDMMAAMLKPMLKEWLDANMPRIVAKAMGGKDEAGSAQV